MCSSDLMLQEGKEWMSSYCRLVEAIDESHKPSSTAGESAWKEDRNSPVGSQREVSPAGTQLRDVSPVGSQREVSPEGTQQRDVSPVGSQREVSPEGTQQRDVSPVGSH